MDDYNSFGRHHLAIANEWDFARFLEPELRPILTALRTTNLKQNRLGLAMLQQWGRKMWACNLEQIETDTVEVTGFAIPEGNLAGEPRFFVDGEPISDVELHIPNPIDMAVDPEGGRHFGMRFRIHGINIFDMSKRVEISMASGPSWAKPNPLDSVWVGPSKDPLPAIANLTRIGGRDGSVEQYLKFGATFIYKLEHLLREMGYDGFQSFGRILDWGCGCGRMLRFFNAADRSRLTGIDIDPQNVEWSKANMPGIAFECVAVDPPTPFEDDSFDLIYANSVVPHLTVDDQFAWLKELARITAPEGIVALTVHARYSWVLLGWQEMDPLATVIEEGIRVAPDLNPDIADVPGNRYTDTHHMHEYIYREWSQYFEILGIVEGFSNTQAVVVMKVKL